MLFVLLTVVTWVVSVYLPDAYFPWWSFLVPCMALGLLFGKSRKHALLSGFAAVFLLWFVWALVIDMQNGGILTTRMATLFSLPSRWLLAPLSALVGGLLGAMATWAGYALRRL